MSSKKKRYKNHLKHRGLYWAIKNVDFLPTTPASYDGNNFTIADFDALIESLINEKAPKEIIVDQAGNKIYDDSTGDRKIPCGGEKVDRQGYGRLLACQR
jgi:hypothetical protein